MSAKKESKGKAQAEPKKEAKKEEPKQAQTPKSPEAKPAAAPQASSPKQEGGSASGSKKKRSRNKKKKSSNGEGDNKDGSAPAKNDSSSSEKPDSSPKREEPKKAVEPVAEQPKAVKQEKPKQEKQGKEKGKKESGKAAESSAAPVEKKSDSAPAPAADSGKQEKPKSGKKDKQNKQQGKSSEDKPAEKPAEDKPAAPKQEEKPKAQGENQGKKDKKNKGEQQQNRQQQPKEKKSGDAAESSDVKDAPAKKEKGGKGGEGGKDKQQGKKDKGANKDGKPAEKDASADGGEEKGEKGKGKGKRPLPEWMEHRVKIWDECAARRAAERKSDGKKDITVLLPNGSKVAAVAGETTPMDIAKKLSVSLANRAVIARLDDKEKWDLIRPLEKDCKLEILDFDSKEGSHTFWHSSAHILGQAIEFEFKDAQLCIGPPVEDGGFYYDAYLGDQKISPDHFKAMEKTIKGITSEKQPFQRLVLKKEEAVEMFKGNKFKLEIIKNKVPDGATCTAYRCGPLIDLCKGPHLPDTGRVKALEITKNASAYWLGKAENPSLQRVYGISFPDKKQLEEYKERLRLAEERDHRKLGQQQKLFFFHQLSPGSCFFLPHGARVYNKLIEFIRGQYRQRGYTEVVTPNVFHTDLWRTSGHYDNYKENMFIFECEKQEFGMKPMNCPGHCLMFDSDLRSYRDLPIRLADFGVLHRNEYSGALTGLTRVRRFQQDDAHIFCRQDQIEQEVGGVLDFLKTVYGILGFTFELKLSTRPEKFLGEVKTWDEAEAALTKCLNNWFGDKWSINAGDGAFYGPKIDIQLTDALKRKHQCATVQLDFQLPIRFKLEFKNEKDQKERPVIIHRAILGSVERMMAVLIEHTGGKWPLWLSPRQVVVLPISEKYLDYARKVHKAIFDKGYYCDLDESNDTLKKKIRDAQLSQYNIIIVVGAEEQERNTVNIRNRDNDDKYECSVQELLERMAKQCSDWK